MNWAAAEGFTGSAKDSGLGTVQVSLQSVCLGYARFQFGFVVDDDGYVPIGTPTSGILNFAPQSTAELVGRISQHNPIECSSEVTLMTLSPQQQAEVTAIVTKREVVFFECLQYATPLVPKKRGPQTGTTVWLYLSPKQIFIKTKYLFIFYPKTYAVRLSPSTR